MTTALMFGGEPVQPIDATWRDYAIKVIVHYWGERSQQQSDLRAIVAATPQIEWEGRHDNQLIGAAIVEVDGYVGLRKYVQTLNDTLIPFLSGQSWAQVACEPLRVPRGFLFAINHQEG